MRSLEESERVRNLPNVPPELVLHSYPERLDIIADLQSLAAQLQGRLEEPCLRRKYAWTKPAFGWKAAKWAQSALPQLKASCFRQCDKAMYMLESAAAATLERDDWTAITRNMRGGQQTAEKPKNDGMI